MLGPVSIEGSGSAPLNSGAQRMISRRLSSRTTLDAEATVACELIDDPPHPCELDKWTDPIVAGAGSALGNFLQSAMQQLPDRLPAIRGPLNRIRPLLASPESVPDQAARRTYANMVSRLDSTKA